MRWVGVLVGCVVLAIVTPIRADFQAGVQAYEQGDYVTALKEWRPLAEEGQADAQFYVGALYYHGEGVPQSNIEAARWYRRAADGGHAAAQHNLGVMLYTGEGMPEDPREAFRWFQRAANQGHGPAQYNLGILYAEGSGTSPDNVQAFLWFSLAAAQNEVNAQQAKAFVAGRMTPAQLAEAERLARQWKPTRSSAAPRAGPSVE